MTVAAAGVESAAMSLRASFRRDQMRRGLAARTIRERDKVLDLLERSQETRLLALSREQIDDWLDTRRLCPRSRTSYLSTLHCFYAWTVDEGFRSDDPTARIRRPKLPRLVPRPIENADLSHALRVAPPRMKAWLALAAYEGLRCKEIAEADMQDLHLEHDPAVLVVHGKGDKERVVPLHPLVLVAVQASSSTRPGPLFRNARDSRFSPAAVSQQINAFLHGLGISATAHTLRHRFGTEVYRLSHDLRLTQELLGHASPTTTAVYAAWNPTESARVVEQLSLPIGMNDCVSQN